MTFYKYWAEFAIMIGSTKSEIIKTLEYYCARPDCAGYSIKIPSEKEIPLAESPLNVTWVNPMSSNNHWLKIPLLEDVILNVNANAFADATEYALTARQLYRRGELFKYTPPTHLQTFLPEVIIATMEEHDWNQHLPEIERMLEDRNKTLDRMAELNFLVRVKIKNDSLN